MSQLLNTKCLMAYFIKYTHDRNLFPPELRLSVAALFTLALLGAGCRLLKNAKYRIFGTALAGAGFAGLYLCVFASVSVYHLLSAWVGLAGLVVVTAAGVALALRFNSIILAVLAVCGGYLAPILMDTKEMATHSSTLAWKIPWTEEPERLQCMGSQRNCNSFSHFRH